MKELKRAMEYVAESDPILHAHVWRDDEQEWQIYPLVAPQNTQPPYIVYQIVPGPVPEGHYGDIHAMEPTEVQWRVWAESLEHAWLIFDALNEHLEDADIDVELTPYYRLYTRRMGTPSEDLELNTGLYSVTAVYRFAIAR